MTAAAGPGPVPDAWYVLVNGSSHGPYTWQQLMTYASDGRIAADAMIRRPEGMVVPLSLLVPRG